MNPLELQLLAIISGMPGGGQAPTPGSGVVILDEASGVPPVDNLAQRLGRAPQTPSR